MSDNNGNKRLSAEEAGQAIAGLIVFGLIGFVVWVIYFAPKSSPEPPDPNAVCDDLISAFVMSQEFVKDRLRSPGSAEFPLMSENGVAVQKLDGCKFLVIAYVDSQNGFGALLRTHYIAELRATPGTDHWRLTDIVLVPQ